MKFIKNFLSIVLIVAVILAGAYYIDFNEIGKTVSQKLSQIQLNTISSPISEQNQQHHYKTQQSSPVILPYSQTDNSNNNENLGYCYAQMDERQQLYYRLILSAFEDMWDGFFEISNSDPNCKNNVNIAFNGVLNDNPEIFWQDNTYEIKITNETEYSLKLGFSMDKDERDQKRQLLKNKLNEILGKTKTFTKPQKEIFFYELLCRNTEYSQIDQNTEYTAFGALCEGIAMCEGYAKAMQLLCKTSNIECLLVRGVVDDNLHMWNLINLSDGWYELDVTLSDRDNCTPNYIYFNATSDEISASHSRLNDITNIDSADLSDLSYNFFLPEATATLYNRDAIIPLYEYTP